MNEKLKVLLMNFWVLFFNAHNAHWNITGLTFTASHEFFKNLYESTHGYADDIAEYMRQMNQFAPAAIEDLSLATISTVSQPLLALTPACWQLVSNYDDIIKQIEELLPETTADPALNNLLMGMVQKMKKERWQINSHIN